MSMYWNNNPEAYADIVNRAIIAHLYKQAGVDLPGPPDDSGEGTSYENLLYIVNELSMSRLDSDDNKAFAALRYAAHDEIMDGERMHFERYVR